MAMTGKNRIVIYAPTWSSSERLMASARNLDPQNRDAGDPAFSGTDASRVIRAGRECRRMRGGVVT
jgi:hypothetical protein